MFLPERRIVIKNETFSAQIRSQNLYDGESLRKRDMGIMIPGILADSQLHKEGRQTHQDQHDEVGDEEAAPCTPEVH